VTHDLLRHWLPHCESALLVHDSDAGYRSFLAQTRRRIVTA